MITNEEIQKMKGQIQKAQAELTGCPVVQHETDTDCVIGDGLAAGAKILAEVTDRGEKIEMMKNALNKIAHDSAVEGIKARSLAMKVLEDIGGVRMKYAEDQPTTKKGGEE